MKTATSHQRASLRKTKSSHCQTRPRCQWQRPLETLRGASTPTITPALAAWLAKPKQNLIGGKWVSAVSGRSFEVFNPANDSVIARAAEGEVEDINRAVAAARRAFDSPAWRRMTPSERGKLVWRIGDLILEHADRSAELESFDNGKTPRRGD